MKWILVFASMFLAAGCVSDRERYNIDYESLSSRLYVENPSGENIQPLSGQIVDVARVGQAIHSEGVGIGPEAIRLAPGEYWIRTNCPPGPSGIQVSHGPPTIKHEFEVGEAYLLRCT